MPLSKLQFTPGINKEMTDLMDKGGWSDGNLVRFRKGLPEKIWGIFFLRIWMHFQHPKL